MKSLVTKNKQPNQTMRARLQSRFQTIQNSARSITQHLKAPLKTEPPVACAPDSLELADFNNPKKTLISWANKQTQWWYFTGHLRSMDGEEFGFQCVFFERHAHHDFVGPLPTRMIKSEYYVSHFAISHLSSKDILKSFRYHQRGGVANSHFGVSSESNFEIQVDHWKSGSNQDGFYVEAHEGDDSLNLRFKAKKKLIRHGLNGFVAKSEDHADGSFYCSYSRLSAEGTIRIAAREYQVMGQAWMDHEKMSCNDQVFHRGWDWYSIQLDNDCELMLYRLKKNSTDYAIESSGSYVDPQGGITHLNPQDFNIQHLEFWKSARSGAVYPIVHQISIPKLQLKFTIRPRLLDQEMDTLRTSFCCYWEGPISVVGEIGEKRVFGKGYLELAGYDPRPHATVLKLLTLP